MGAMKRIVVLSVVALALVLSSRAAEAKGVQGSSFGIGLIVYQPTGLSAQLRLSRITSIDFALGFSDHHFEDDRWYFHMDYLVSPVNLSEHGTVGVPLYLGIGGFIHDGGGDDLHLGVRVPFGIAIEWRTAPLQLFLEGSLRVLLISEEAHNHDRVDLSGAFGFRIFF
jgi:hypothetical protein